MFRKHFFLIIAGLALIGVLVFGGIKMFAGESGAATGAGGPAGAAGPGRGAGAGGPGGRGGGRGGRGAGGPVPVTAATATPHTFTDYVQVLGVAKARQSVTITSSTSELVTRVLFRDGQEVANGQVLLELKSQSEDAGIATAQANLALAKLNAERYATLARQDAVPQALADQYRTQYAVAQAALEAAQANKLDRVIRAPFNGRVGLSDVAPGALISPGSAIVSLDDLSVVKVDFAVPDRYLSMLRVGGAITAQADTLGERQIRGRIAQLDTRIDEKTRTINARAEFPNPDRAIRPGMLMRVGISSGSHQGVAVPESAIQLEDQQAIVYVIANSERGAIAERTPITSGNSDGDLVDVISGLRPGQQVVADGLDKITPGGQVRVVGGATGGRGAGATAGRGGEGRAPGGSPRAGAGEGARPGGAPSGAGGRQGGGRRGGGQS